MISGVANTGCQIERLQLETRGRLERALHTYDAFAWRLLWPTYVARQQPEQPCTLALSEEAWQVLHRYHAPQAAV